MQAAIPNVLPGSQVTITPVSHQDLNIVGTPILAKTSPLPVVADPSSPAVPLTYLATPGTGGIYTPTTSNVIDFKIVLDKPVVGPPKPEPKPTPVPTLSEWGLGLSGAMLAGLAAIGWLKRGSRYRL